MNKSFLDHIYKAKSTTSPDVTNQLNTLQTSLTSLSNIAAKTNIANTFTANQTMGANLSVHGNVFLNSNNPSYYTQIGVELRAGTGAASLKIRPEDDGLKTIYFGKNPNNRVGRFDLDLQQQSKILGLSNPENDYQAANKKYVDDKFKTVFEDRTINNTQKHTYNLPSGYKLVSVQVGRKRTTDNRFLYEPNFSYQILEDIANGAIEVYNAGSVNNFSNDFRIKILYVKV